MTKTFQIGQTYSTRSACDYDCIFSWTVVGRTAKRIQLKDKRGDIKTVGVKTYQGVEIAKPQGSYSMAPIISAEEGFL